MNHQPWEEMRTLYRDGELPAGERARFEEHLQSCPACREALELDTVLASELQSAFDDLYPADLETRLQIRLESAPVPGAAPEQGALMRLGNWLRYGEFRLPAPVALAAVLAFIVVGAALLLGRGSGGPGPGPVPGIGAAAGEIIAIEDAEQEILSLLTRTRTLMLALSTAHPDSSGAFDLTAERALGRDLIHEYRILEAREGTDGRTEILDLIRDLEVILLDLSTWEGQADAQQVAMLQGGITDRSLIYRLSTYEPTIGGD